MHFRIKNNRERKFGVLSICATKFFRLKFILLLHNFVRFETLTYFVAHAFPMLKGLAAICPLKVKTTFGIGDFSIALPRIMR